MSGGLRGEEGRRGRDASGGKCKFVCKWDEGGRGGGERGEGVGLVARHIGGPEEKVIKSDMAWFGVGRSGVRRLGVGWSVEGVFSARGRGEGKKGMSRSFSFCFRRLHFIVVHVAVSGLVIVFLYSTEHDSAIVVNSSEGRLNQPL